MISNDDAQRDYETARIALNRIVRSSSASEDQKREARRQRDDLIDNYIDKLIDNVKERTKQYVAFIEKMETVINNIGKDSPLAGIQKLKDIVDNAASVVKTLRGGPGGA